MEALHRVEKIDVLHGALAGLAIDLIAMFGLWPAFNQPFPTLGQAVITIVFGQAAGILIVLIARVTSRRRR